LGFRAGKDNLYGVRPEGAVPEGQTQELFAASVVKSQPISQPCELLILRLSHELPEIKESDAPVWGYFADGRFIQADVQPALRGVDGAASIEVPDGLRPLQTLQAGPDESGDKVHGFDFRSPETFVDTVKKRTSKPVKYHVEVSYALPDGMKTSLRLAEGQAVVAYDESKKLVEKKAYQLKSTDRLVCGFGANGEPQTVGIDRLEGREAPLGAYLLTLKTCPWVRANGVLVRMDVAPTQVFPGVAVDSRIQMAPSVEAIRSASEDRIDLAQAEELSAGQVSSGARALAYNTAIPPRSFRSSRIAGVEDEEGERYVRVITAHTTLLCGLLWEI